LAIGVSSRIELILANSYQTIKNRKELVSKDEVELA